MEALSSAIPCWVSNIGDRRRLERAWLRWRLAVAATATAKGTTAAAATAAATALAATHEAVAGNAAAAVHAAAAPAAAAGPSLGAGAAAAAAEGSLNGSHTSSVRQLPSDGWVAARSFMLSSSQQERTQSVRISLHSCDVHKVL